jgi:cytochrome P450
MSDFDATNSSFHADPYPGYAQLRSHSPVLWYPEMGFWLMTRYADVASALRDPGTFSHESFWDEPVSRHDPDDPRQAYVVQSFSKILMYKDGETHGRMRRQGGKSFAPRVIKDRRAGVERICRALLENCRAKGSFDYAQDFAMILPSMVVADYLGIPAQDREEIRELADRFSVIFEPFLGDGERRDMLVHSAALGEYLDEIIESRRENPRDDVISILVSHGEPDGGMTAEELRGNLMHLLVAGNETTTNLLGHAMVALSRLPDVRARVRADAALAGPFVEEALRFEAPIQLVGRKLTRDLELHGQQMPAGALIALVVASANRDEERFDEPDTFNIDRQANQHLSLGAGPHFCLGAPLARLEGAVAVEMLTQDFNDLVIDDTAPPPTWKDDQLLRGYTHLHVRSDPVAAAT